ASRNTNGAALGALPALPKGLCLGESSEVGGQNPEVSDAGGTPALQFAHVDGDQVVIDGTGLLQAYDVMGRLLFSTEVNSQLSIFNSQFPSAGVYVLRLNGKSQKIVIR
ncbi:MAG: T9SS type A sorting domain-containing protein, partial [Bacteroidales bacterium]|nr:T9SS type A sorting domain-containing protein [Bacteroidales bacterium]